jgi:hypothetical protein
MHSKLALRKSSLFGDITGYRWHFSPGASLEFDVHGRTRKPATPGTEGTASLQYQRKSLTIGQLGIIAIGANEP